jgi:hypothetical protein
MIIFGGIRCKGELTRRLLFSARLIWNSWPRGSCGLLEALSQIGKPFGGS